MYKYPKIFLLCATFLIAYVLYHQGFFDFLDRINGYGYVSVFVAGLFFSFGFTTPFAVAAFVEIAPFMHPLVAAPIAGVGAFLSDRLIFDVIRFAYFHDEIRRIQLSRPIRWIRSLIHRETVSERVRRYLLLTCAGLVIASPLPDEFGVTLMSAATRIDSRTFCILSFTLNTVGIYVILQLARLAA